jgi:hypothetical protein
MSNCFYCIHKRSVPGNSHISCAKPDKDMTGDLHAIRKGWFIYPILFDPRWMMKECANFEEKNNEN